MSNEEAKEILKHIGNNVVTINTYDGKIWHKEDIAEAKAIATHAIDELPSVTPQPCDDVVSREAVMNIVKRWYPYKAEIGQLKALPSVTPQQRTGRWIQKEEEDEAEPFIIWECSECHCVDEDGKPSYKYCPQCGVKMEVEE